MFVGGYWGIKENQKQFFIDVASARGFDALVALNWYDIGGDSSLSSFAHKFRVIKTNFILLFILFCILFNILKKLFFKLLLQGGLALLEYYDKSFSKALVHLFPNIPFDIKKFRSPYLGIN